MATVTPISTLQGASWTGTPAYCDAGREKIVCTLQRGKYGSITLLRFLAGDGRDVAAPVELRDADDEQTGQRLSIDDAFGAAPFISAFDQTLKAFVNYKPAGGANDRRIGVVATGRVPVVTP